VRSPTTVSPSADLGLRDGGQRDRRGRQQGQCAQDAQGHACTPLLRARRRRTQGHGQHHREDGDQQGRERRAAAGVEGRGADGARDGLVVGVARGAATEREARLAGTVSGANQA
jgi:hypothetical protein